MFRACEHAKQHDELYSVVFRFSHGIMCYKIAEGTEINCNTELFKPRAC